MMREGLACSAAAVGPATIAAMASGELPIRQVVPVFLVSTSESDRPCEGTVLLSQDSDQARQGTEWGSRARAVVERGSMALRVLKVGLEYWPSTPGADGGWP